MKVNPDAEAILLWFAQGRTPTDDDFVAAGAPMIGEASTPLSSNPATHWTLESAVVHAAKVVRDHDKVPWIKSDGRIFGPSEISQVNSALRAMSKFNAYRS